MNYRQVYKKVCLLAADHLYSLEVYNEFDPADVESGRVDDAIRVLQNSLRRRGGMSVLEAERAQKKRARPTDDQLPL